MGFETLDSAIPQPRIEITPDLVAFDDEMFSDEAALSIVLQDAEIAEKYLQSKSLIASFDLADDLYRAYVKPKMWANGKPRASLPMPLVLEAIEKILPAIHLTLWGNNTMPFTLVPKGKASGAAARAKAKVLAWAVKQSNLKEEMRRSLKSALLYGFTVGNWGWESREQKLKTYVREDGKIVAKTVTKTINQPTYQCLDLRKVLIDPAANTQDVRKSAKYVIFQIAMTANDLDALRTDPAYQNIPSREELAMIMATRSANTQDSLAASKSNSWRDLQAESDMHATTSNPLDQPIELLEYWSDTRVITILQRQIVIRNEPNEFGRKTQVSCAFIDVLNSFMGFGVAKLLSGEQKFVQGVRNAWVDSLALALNPMFQLAKGIGPGTQQITASPGKVVTESGTLTPLQVGSVSPEALTAITNAEERAYRMVAANGGSNMPSQAMRTAEGVQAFASDVTTRLQYFMDTFIELMFIPVLEAFLELCTDRLLPEQINEILSEEDGKAYEGDILDVYNANVGIEILAGTKLTTRRAAAQLVPMLVALVSNQAVQQSFVVQNKKFNYEELIEQTLDLMGWDLETLIVEMTPEDQQRAQMMQDAFVRGQQQLALEQTKHQNDLENIDAKGMAQAGVAVVRNMVKEHSDEANQMLESLNNPTGVE